MSETAEVAPHWTLGWRLQRSLAWAEVSVEEMARELDVSRSTISRWCHDQGAPPRSIYLRAWSHRCRVPYEWLQHGDEGPTSGETSYIRSGIHEDSLPGYHPVDSEFAAGMKPISHLVPLVRPADAARIRGAAR